jgi:hypothetical protein
MVLLSVLSSVAMLVVLFATLQTLFTPAVALGSLAVLSMNPLMVRYGGSIASETPFALFTVIAIAMLARPSESPRRNLVAGAASIAATLTRLAGVPLLAGVGLDWLLQRRWRRSALYALACAVTIGAWLAWSAAAPEQFVGKSYIADVTSRGPWQGGPWTILRRIPAKLYIYMGQEIPHALAIPTIPGTPVDNLIGVTILAAGLLAGLVVLLRRWRVAALTLLAYAGMLLVYPWNTGRFVVPMFTLMVPALIVGLAWLGGRLRTRTGWVVMAVPALILFVSGAVRTSATVRANAGCDRSAAMPAAECMRRDQASFFEALRYIEAETEPDAVFLSMKPEPLYLYTGRRSVGARRALAQPDERFIAHLRGEGASYVLLGSVQIHEIGEMARLLELHCASLRLIEYFPARTYLFRIRPAGERDETGRACEAVRAYRAANENRHFERDP